MNSGKASFEPLLALRRATSFPAGELAGIPPSWKNAPVPPAFKRYEPSETRALPRLLVPSSLPATAVLAGACAGSAPLDTERLATLLFLTAGVTRKLRTAGAPTWFRTAMSAGNRHPIECYVLDGQGAWHYDPLGHRLQLVRAVASERAVDGAVVALTAIAWRTCQRYGPRGYRYCYWDAGTVLANLLASSASLGIRAEAIPYFRDAEIRALFALDAGEVPIVLVRLGDQPPALDVPNTPATPSHAGGTPPADFAELLDQLSCAELGPGENGPDRRSPRPRRVERAPAMGPELAGTGSTVEEAILGRGSTRRFSSVPLSGEAYGAACAVLAQPLPYAGGPQLEHLMRLHAVVGQEPAEGLLEGRSRPRAPRFSEKRAVGSASTRPGPDRRPRCSCTRPRSDRSRPATVRDRSSARSSQRVSSLDGSRSSRRPLASERPH